MRTTHETQFRFSVLVFPDDGIRIIDSLQFRIIDDIFFSVFFDQALALFFCFRSQVVNVIETDGTIGSCSSPKIFQIGACFVSQLRTDPFIKTHYIWHIFHDFHTDSAA